MFPQSSGPFPTHRGCSVSGDGRGLAVADGEGGGDHPVTYVSNVYLELSQVSPGRSGPK